MNADAVVRDLSFAQGGPLRRLEGIWRSARARERQPWSHRALTYVALVYAPVLVIGVAQYLMTGLWPGTMTRVYTHVTALVSLPLLFLSEALADNRARLIFAYLVESGIVREEDLPSLRQIIESHARLRASVVFEVVLVAIVIASLVAGQVGLARMSPAGWWQATVATSIFRFLVFRWLWRWALWGVLLFKVARLPLRLTATHADKLGGLSPLLGLSEVAFVVFMAAVSSTAAAGLADLLRIDPDAFASVPLEALALGLTALMVAITPLLFFVPTLARVRKEGLRHYGALAHHHDRAFGARWVNHPEGALGNPDMSSLADLGTGFSRVEEMRPLLWSPRLVKVVLAGTWVPFGPLVLFRFGFVELLGRVVQLVI